MEVRFASSRLRVGLWTVLLKVVCLTAGIEETMLTTNGTKQLTSKSHSTLDFDHTATVKPVQISLLDFTNCSNPFVSLKIVTNNRGDTLLSFSALGNADTPHLSCRLRVTPKPRHFISAVLLEHTLCGGGVYVMLWDNVRLIRWNVCSAWHAPGPDYTALSNETDVTVELNGAPDSCDFTILVTAVKKPHLKMPELRYLSVTEG